MRPQIACMNRCTVALATLMPFCPFWVSLWFLKSLEVADAKSHCLHLYDFFPKLFFKCVLKLPVWTDSKLHWLHLYDFPQKRVFIWFLKSLEVTDEKSHCLHLYNFSPDRVFKCVLKLPVWTDAKLHWLNLCDFSRCVSFLSVSRVAVTDAKSHCLHLYDFSPKGVFKCVLKLPEWTDAKLY